MITQIKQIICSVCQTTKWNLIGLSDNEPNGEPGYLIYVQCENCGFLNIILLPLGKLTLNFDIPKKEKKTK